MNEAMKVEINAMFGDILTVPLKEKAASLFVILDSISYTTPGHQQQPVTRELTILYEIKKPRPGSKENEFGNCRLINSNSTAVGAPLAVGHDTQRADKLASILKKIPIHAGEEILLITWDHGSAFGIFRDQSTDLPSAVLRTPIYDELDKYPYLRRFWYKALEVANGNFKKSIAEKMKEKTDPVIQVGHKLFSFPKQLDRSGFLTKLITDPKTLSLFRVSKNKKEQRELWLDGDYILSAPPGLLDTTLTPEQKSELLELLHLEKAVTIPLGEPLVPEILRNDELASAIAQWLKSKKDQKVGVLLMMNCWMMNFHTLYGLKSCVKCLVAPMGGIDNPGYNYHDILSALYENSQVLTPEELAKKTVDYSHNDFIQKRAALLNPGTIEKRIIVAVSLDAAEGDTLLLDKMVASFKKLMNKFLAILPKDTDLAFTHLLRYVRVLSVDFTDRSYYLIDAPAWLAVLSAVTEDAPNNFFNNPLKFAINDFLTLAGNPALVLNKYQGPTSLLGDNPQQPTTNQLNGIKTTGFSIFFPFIKMEDPDVLDNVNNDLLLNTELKKWKSFLKRLYGTDIIP